MFAVAVFFFACYWMAEHDRDRYRARWKDAAAEGAEAKFRARMAQSEYQALRDWLTEHNVYELAAFDRERKNEHHY